MKQTTLKELGEVVKNNRTYVVKDDESMETMVVSTTRLFPGKETTGHKHDDQEEVYVFVEGSGKIIIDDVEHTVEMGNVITIAKGEHHKVINDSDNDEMFFLCVFPGVREN